MAATLLLLPGLASAASCARPPDVVLVTIDTLRADRLASYGHERTTSPFLDRLAAEGVRFEQAYAASSWTAPSVVSLLTSLPAGIHGVERGFLSGGDVVEQERLPARATLWAEHLSAAGYSTFGVTANLHLAERLGFGRGFDRYVCLGFESAERVEATVRHWADAIRSSRPFFLWLHLFDPHAPYSFRPGYTDAEALGPERYPAIEQAFFPEALAELGVADDPRLVRYVEELYDGEIRYTDAAIERILAIVGVGPEDLVVVTSDHGEELADRGGFGHGHTLHEELIRVPLLLRLPGGAHGGAVVPDPVGQVDVLPTVLDLLGIARADRGVALRGRSLLPLLTAPAAEPREVLGELSRVLPRESRSLRRGRWKYVHHATRPGGTGLFDLASDPGERTNLLEREPASAAALARRLAELEAEHARLRLTAGLSEVPDDEAARLRELGYGN